ncbi:MAG TPA: hypothetical protein VF147_08060 [Vicinamibacterales bacterium]
MIDRRYVIATALSVLAFAMTARAVEAQQPAAVRVPPSVLEKYVGEYVYPDGNTITVRLVGDTLFREIPGQRVPFVPLSETLFMLGPVFTAEFVIDSAGGITQVLSDGAGVEYRLRRKGSPKPPPPPPVAPVSVPESVLEQYVGVYEYIPGQMQRTDLRIVVRLKGDTLIREMGREDVLTPVSETKFRVGETSLTVEFVVDEAGVTQILGTGFQQMLARRTSKR